MRRDFFRKRDSDFAADAASQKREAEISPGPLVVLFLWLSVGQILVAIFLQYGMGIVGFAAIPYLNLASTLVSFATFTYLLGRLIFAGHLMVPTGTVGLWLLAIVLVAVTGFVVGALQENSGLYLMSDTLYYVNWLVGAIAAALVLAKMDNAQIERLVRAIAVTMVAGFILSIGASSMIGLPVPTVVTRVAQCYLGLYAFYKPARHVYVLLASLAVVLLTLFGSNRATILMFLAVILFASWALRRSEVAIALVLAMIIGGTWFLSTAIELVPPDSALGQRLIETENVIEGRGTIENSLASLQRVYESDIISNVFRDNDPAFLITGFGAGATISARAIPGVEVYDGSLLGLDSLHNIHFLHTALLYRHGLIGLGFLTTIVILLLMVGQRLRQASQENPYRFLLTAGSTLYCVATLAYAVPASNFFFSEPLFGFLMSLILALSLSKRTKPSQFLLALARRGKLKEQ